MAYRGAYPVIWVCEWLAIRISGKFAKNKRNFKTLTLRNMLRNCYTYHQSQNRRGEPSHDGDHSVEHSNTNQAINHLRFRVKMVVRVQNRL